MFEQRILCHALPNSFNSISNKNDEKSCTNAQTIKTIQEAKRQALNEKLEHYELRIHQYEKLYHQTFARFQAETSNIHSLDQMHSFDEFMHYVTCYLYQHTKLFLRRIRHKESVFRVKLLRQHGCHRRMSRLSKTVDVYPRIIVDVPHVALNSQQLDYLSRAGLFNEFESLSNSIFEFLFVLIQLGPDYIRPNQSYLYSSERLENEMQREHKTIMETVTTHLVRLHRMPLASTIIEQFSQQLFVYLRERYLAPVSYLDAHRTRKQLKLIKTIQFRLKKYKYILRVTDKSGIFHLAHATDYERKADAYRQKTAAYIELENDPLSSVFDKVVRLLNDLHAKNHIRTWQLEQMMPNREKTALAYLYFIPKPHKVRPIRHNSILTIMNVFSLLNIGRYSIETHCLFNEHTNNSYL